MKTVSELQSAIRAEIDAIDLDEPQDVRFIRRGFFPSEAGAYGQYFSVLVMLGSEVRNLAIHAFSNLVAFSRSDRFSLDQLKTMAREMLRVTTGVVAYFGLRRLAEILCAFLELLDEVKDKDELKGLFEELFTLCNRYQMWLHQTFPWHLGVHFPKKTKAQLEQDRQIARILGWISE
jgi:Cucumopine synthase C-terminal helical bundle domain